MNERKRISGLGIIGAIINLIFALLVLVIFFAMLIDTVPKHRFRINDIEFITMLVIFAFFVFCSIVSFYKNLELLSGNIKKKTAAIIYGFLSLSILGSLFILFSKVIVKVERVKIKIIEKEMDCKELIYSLFKYKQLFDSGVITEEEFKMIKKKLIN